MTGLPDGISIATVNSTKCLCIPVEFQKEFSELALHGGAFRSRKIKLRACAAVLASGSGGPLSASSASVDALVTATFSSTVKSLVVKQSKLATHDFAKVLDHIGTTVDLLPDKEKAKALAPFWKLKFTAKAFSRMLGATVSPSCWKLAQQLGELDYSAGEDLQHYYALVKSADSLEERIEAKKAARRLARQGLVGHVSQGGREALSPSIVDKLVEHCNENSKPSPDNEIVLCKPKKWVRIEAGTSIFLAARAKPEKLTTLQSDAPRVAY